MPNTSTIAFALIVGYIVFIVVRGELPVYLGVIGFGPDKNNTCASGTPMSTQSTSAPVNVSNPTTINILQNSGSPIVSQSPVITNTTINSTSNPGQPSVTTGVTYDPVIGECDYLNADGSCGSSAPPSSGVQPPDTGSPFGGSGAYPPPDSSAPIDPYFGDGF